MVPEQKIEARLDDYKRLIAIAADLSSTLNLSTLLERIAEAAKDVARAEAASILLYDEHAKELYFQVATNIDEPTMRGLVVPLEGSIAGWIVRERKAVCTNDPAHDPRYYGDIAQTTGFPTRSILGVPMMIKNQVVGVLEVLNKVQGVFDETDEHLLSVLAGQAAIAIENTRLFQQFDLISEFVHELRTPLASLNTAAYLLLRPELSGEQHDQIVRNLQKEALRLNELASAFLDLSRLESGRVQFEMGPVNAQNLVAYVLDVMKPRAEAQQVSLVSEIPDDFPEFLGDYNRLKQVFLNLVSNAIKYNRPGGSVRIKADYDEQEVRIAVADTGLGIPEDALPHLFQKFYRVKATEDKAVGTGLGLSISQKIVEGHGGRISVESELGVGTTFTVHLPRRGA